MYKTVGHIKLLSFVILFQVLFGKEADKLEHANDDERTYYIIEKDALVSIKSYINISKNCYMKYNRMWCNVTYKNFMLG